MRGKQSRQHTFYNPIRITPADAGKTSIQHAGISQYRDHPRGCGENYWQADYIKIKSGSPPRMRGKLADAHARRQCGRITPADAGKTSTVELVQSAK